MKALSKFSILALAVVMTFVLVRCEDDETVLSSISGQVTYPTFSGSSDAAAGAVVYLVQGQAEGTNYDMATVADAGGNYTFNELADGEYTIWANYDTKNENLQARVTRTMFLGEATTAMVSGADVTGHNMALVNVGQPDAMAVNTFDGGDWSSDLSHTNVDFEFPYDKQVGGEEYNATYTGRFAEWDMKINFNPAGGGELWGQIDLLSIKTDSPGGRDALYNADGSFWTDPETGEYDLGCVSGTFSISDPDDSDRYAEFQSSSISAYGDGYVATGTMTFNGNTGTVNIFFKFLPGFQAENRSGNLTQFSSFEGFFEFAALNDFGVESGHVGDGMVTVRVSYQVTKPL